VDHTIPVPAWPLKLVMVGTPTPYADVSLLVATCVKTGMPDSFLLNPKTNVLLPIGEQYTYPPCGKCSVSKT
jgi:hypothetical protein